MSAEWQDHDGPLPTLPGMVSGVVAFDDTSGSTTMTVQCAACYRTVTDWPIHAANKINFARGYEISGGLSEYGTHPYRRCLDCRKTGRHPAAWQEALL